MRPHDIVILLKIIAIKHDDWKNSDLAQSLQISASEISEALNRCMIAGLIDTSIDTKRVGRVREIKMAIEELEKRLNYA
jgi:predicted transcriptional regulator